MKSFSLIIASLCSLEAAELTFDFNSHLNFAVGGASTDEASLATHGHDPNDEFTLQGLELNSSVRYGEHLAGFVSYNTFLDSENDIDGELEEAFIKLHELPANLEFRAGRFLNRVTTQNSQHLHSWSFTDANLTTPRFLGEEGLISESIELSYKLPFEHNSLLSVAFGDAVSHDEHDEEEHDHSEHEEEVVDGHGAVLSKEVLSARLKGIYQHSDFHQYTYGISYLHGENGYGKNSNISGADLSYQWRENGIESGGKHLNATLEMVYRDFDYSNHDGDIKGSADDWGIHSSLGWGFTEQWELGLRNDYLQGVSSPVEDLEERNRTSAAITRSIEYNDYLAGHVRLQYNYDWSGQYAQEHAIWLQFQIDFGTGGEVR